MFEKSRMLNFAKESIGKERAGKQASDESQFDSGFKKWSEFIKPIMKRGNAKLKEIQG